MDCFISDNEMVLKLKDGYKEWCFVKDLNIGDVIYDGLMLPTNVLQILESANVGTVIEINYTGWIKSLIASSNIQLLSMYNDTSKKCFIMKWTDIFSTKRQGYLSLPNSIFYSWPSSFSITNLNIEPNKFWGTLFGLLCFNSFLKDPETLIMTCPFYIFEALEKDFIRLSIINAERISPGAGSQNLNIKLITNNIHVIELFTLFRNVSGIPKRFWCANKEYISSLFNIIRILRINEKGEFIPRSKEMFETFYWLVTNLGYTFTFSLDSKDLWDRPLIITGKTAIEESGVLSNIKNIDPNPLIPQGSSMKCIKTESFNGIIVNGIAIK